MRIVLFVLLSFPIIHPSLSNSYGPSRPMLKHKPIVSPGREEVVLYPTSDCIEDGQKFVIPIKEGCHRLPSLHKWKYGTKVYTSRSLRFYANFNCTGRGDNVIVRVVPPEPNTPSKCNDLSQFLLSVGSFLPLEHYSLSNTTETFTVLDPHPGKNSSRSLT